MALELVYTSAARGLRDGTSGFCTVAMTRALPPALVPRLEALSGYRQHAGSDPQPALSFWRLETAQGAVCVLARVAPAPPDHTNRSNKLATFLVLGSEELCAAGPAWLLAHAPFRTSWSGASAWIEAPLGLPSAPDQGAMPCAQWERACGDAGWAGVLASAFLRDMGRPAHIVYAPGTDPLALALEAASLLPPWARWRATFSTLFLQPVAGAPCAWRFCMAGTPGAESVRGAKTLVLDLTHGLGQAPESRHVRAARTGVLEPAPEDAREPAGRESAGGVHVTQSIGASLPGGGLRSEPPPYELAALSEDTSRRAARSPTWAVGSEGAKSAADVGADSGSATPALRARRPSAALLGVLAATVSVAAIIAVVWWAVEPRTSSGPARGTASTSPLTPSSTSAASPSGPSAGHVPAGEQPASVQDASPPHAPLTREGDSARGAVAPDGPDASRATNAPTTLADTGTPAQANTPALTSNPTNTDFPAPAPNSSEQLTASPEPEASMSPWIVLTKPRGDTTLGWTVQVPPELKAASVTFRVPAFLEAAGVEPRGDQIRFPGRSGQAEALLKDGGLEISVPQVFEGIEALNDVVPRPIGSTKESFAADILRRTPLELRSAEGRLVARARVEGPGSLYAAEPGKSIAYTAAVREPELRLASFKLEGKERTLLERRTCTPSEALTLPGGRSPVEIQTTATPRVTVAARVAPVNRAQVRAELSAEVERWQEVESSALTLRKRLSNINKSDVAVARALAVVQATLNEEEMKIIRGTKEPARSIEDVKALREVLPLVEARARMEKERIQRELTLASAPTPGTVAVEISGSDGFLLATLYPEGAPR